MFDALRKVGRLSNYDKGPLDRIAAKVRLPLDRLYNERIIPDVRKLSDAGKPTAHGQGPARDDRQPARVAEPRAYRGDDRQGAEQRGARVSLLTCGGGLPICEVGWARRAWPRPCDRCAHFTDRVAAESGFPHYRLADYLPWGR